MQLEAISSHPITSYLGEETNTCFTTTSFQLVVESPDPSPASLLFSGHTPAPQCPSCSEEPKTEHSTRGAASPVLSTGPRSPPYSCWPHYSWYKPGCRWPSWPPGHTAGSCSASCQPAPAATFLLGNFPTTLPQVCSIAWGCCEPSVGPGIWPCWSSYNWPWPIDPVCPDPSAEPSYPRADEHSHPTWCHLETYWGSTQSLHPSHW